MPIASFVSALPQRLLVTLAWLVSVEAQALTLGRVQGAALIGRPLDVSVQLQLDPNQSIANDCFQADVFHADTRQNPAGVRVMLEPTASPQSPKLRITSDSRIDEPVVTVYLRAGCAQISSRRYVLLADIVSEQAEPAPRVTSVPLVDPSRISASPVPAAASATGASGSIPAVSSPAGTPGETAVRPAARSRPRPETEPRRPASAQAEPVTAIRRAPQAGPAARPGTPRGDKAPAAAAPSTPRGASRSRLQLDPLEMLSERVATLESNATTSAAPAQFSERDAREVERLDRLEASVKALLVLAEKNEASLLDVRNRLETAQAERVSSMVIYALLGLLLLSLAVIAYLLARINRGPQASGSRWFEVAPQSSESGARPPASAAGSNSGALRQVGSVGASSSSPAPLAASAPTPFDTGLPQTDQLPIEPTRQLPRDGLVPGSGVSNAQVDVSLVEMSESTFDRLMQSGSAQTAVRRSQETVPVAVAKDTVAQAPAASERTARIDADELIDIRQRAEFFVTLGQTDQAVQVLEARIAQDGASCPQAYLDLFKLFHALGLKADFNQLREDFVRLFNARVPVFADFNDEGRSLEDYPGAVDRVIRVWRRPTVLDTLEQLLLRSQIADAPADNESFDLAAFHDLLMLHAVAQAVLRSGGAGRSGAFRAPSPAAIVENGQLDIDLSELIAPEAASTLLLPQAEGRKGRPVGSAVDVPVDGDLAADAASPYSSDNLIDFDLSDNGILKKPGQGS